MKILVFGGRDYGKSEREIFLLNETLDEFNKMKSFSVLISGGAKGADKLAELWANSKGIPTKIYYANWKRFHRKAGPVRNQLIIDSEKIDLAFKFPGGSGTADMYERVKLKGIYCVEVG